MDYWAITNSAKTNHTLKGTLGGSIENLAIKEYTRRLVIRK